MWKRCLAGEINLLLRRTVISKLPIRSTRSLGQLTQIAVVVKPIIKSGTMNGTQTKCEVVERQWDEVKVPVPWGYVSGKWWGPRDQQPVIALHGWQDNAGTWDCLAPLLPKNIPIFAIDLPGHGLSSHYPPGQSYNIFWDGPPLLRRLVKHFDWKPITILGHSLGGIIGFLYSATFPDDVDKLIQIDIVCPPIRPVTKLTETYAESIDRFLKYENLTSDQVPCYKYEEMIDIVFDAYRGSVTRESSHVLMRRGMMPSPKGSGYLFSRDVRLKVGGAGFFTLEQCLHCAEKIKCKFLNIRAKSGLKFDDPSAYKTVLNKLHEHNTRVQCVEVEGTHHLHLNTPENVVDLITDFLLDSSGDVI